MGAAASASAGGAAAMAFASYVARGELPPPEALRHEDVFDKYFFDLNSTSDRDGPVFQPALESCIGSFPLDELAKESRPRQFVSLGLYLRCKYDGQRGFRPPKRFVIVLDASGSMAGAYDAGCPTHGSRLDVSRRALAALLAPGSGALLGEDQITVLVTSGAAPAETLLPWSSVAEARAGLGPALEALPGVGAPDWLAVGAAVKEALGSAAPSPSPSPPTPSASSPAPSPPAPSASLSVESSAEEVQAFLLERSFDTCVRALAGFTGKDLFALERGELKDEFGVQGLRLWSALPRPDRNHQTLLEPGVRDSSHVLVFSALQPSEGRAVSALASALQCAQAPPVRSLWLTSALELSASARKNVLSNGPDAALYHLVPPPPSAPSASSSSAPSSSSFSSSGERKEVERKEAEEGAWLRTLCEEFEYLVCPAIRDVSVHFHAPSFHVSQAFGFESARESMAQPDRSNGEVCALGSIRPSQAHGTAVKGGVLLLQLQRRMPRGKRWEDSGEMRVAISYIDLDGERQVDVFPYRLPVTLPPLVDERGEELPYAPLPEVCTSPAMRKTVMLWHYVSLTLGLLAAPREKNQLRRKVGALLAFFEEQARDIGDPKLLEEVEVWGNVTDALPELSRCSIM